MVDEEVAFDEELEETETIEDVVEEGPKPTLSDILLTAEEKLARKEYRMNASKCCIQEAWRMYRRVTKNDNAIEPANLLDESSDPMLTRMGVLYDPTAGLRMRFLQKKFAHLLAGFMALKQAAYRPFIRYQKPKRIDVEGQGRAMPAVAKAFHPEVYVTYKHPSTFAYKEKWSKIFNSNFISKEDILRDLEDKETQIQHLELYSSKKFRKVDKKRDLSVEKFDIEDIPLDNDGNPIGRSVGHCEWCGKSILPIPSEYTLSVEWHIDALYCCKKYRQFTEDIKKATLVLEAEYEKKNFLIDSSAKKPKKKAEEQLSLEDRQSSSKAMIGKMMEFLQEKYTEPEEKSQYDVSVDTLDLPWDPAETRYHQQMRVNAEGQHLGKSNLNNIDILLELEEVYANRDTMIVPSVFE